MESTTIESPRDDAQASPTPAAPTITLGTVPTAPGDGSGARAPSPGSPGIIVGGRYILLGCIGAGSMGSVWEAEDQLIGRRVALKLLDRLCVKDAGRRFRREAHAAASIQHPNVVVVHDFQRRHDGSYYIVQELLRGSSLRRHLEKVGEMSHIEALDIMIPIMSAIIAAHRKGVIHRDIKPENIFLAETPLGGMVAKLIDFGIALAPETLTARATSSRKGVVGTLSYMSPEQIRDDSVDERTDVWATAVVLYEMLAGSTPFQEPTMMKLIARLRASERAPRISSLVDHVPEELGVILDRALVCDPGARYESMERFFADVLAFAQRDVPEVLQRHAGSIPAYVEPMLPPPGQVDEPALDEAPVTGPRRLPVRPSRRLLAAIESEVGPGSVRADDLELARRAEEDLRVNALDEALKNAGRALVGQPEHGPFFGRMRLVQAAAGRWLGRFAEAERWGREALAHLPWRSSSWYAAFGHLALVTCYLGHVDELVALTGELGRAEGRTGPHLMAACRLVTALAHSGKLDRAREVFDRAQHVAELLSLDEPDVLAWLDVANAALELHQGNISTYLQLLELAVEGFGRAGAVRNACLQRCSVGNAYMRFGLYRRAEHVLCAAIRVGEPMRLNFIAPARVNLGLSLARLGDLDQARAVETAALDRCARQGNRRFEAVARVYRAEILLRSGDAAGAEEDAARAVRGALIPGLRAYALAMLADVLLARGRAAEALPVTAEAMKILDEVDGLEEGEPLIRLTRVLALAAAGDMARASHLAWRARERVMQQADKITEPAWRRSFLENVPENARTLALEMK